MQCDLPARFSEYSPPDVPMKMDPSVSSQKENTVFLPIWFSNSGKCTISLFRGSKKLNPLFSDPAQIRPCEYSKSMVRNRLHNRLLRLASLLYCRLSLQKVITPNPEGGTNPYSGHNVATRWYIPPKNSLKNPQKALLHNYFWDLSNHSAAGDKP